MTALERSLNTVNKVVLLTTKMKCG